jgi:hypothetical protein
MKKGRRMWLTLPAVIADRLKSKSDDELKHYVIMATEARLNREAGK